VLRDISEVAEQLGGDALQAAAASAAVTGEVLRSAIQTAVATGDTERLERTTKAAASAAAALKEAAAESGAAASSGAQRAAAAAATAAAEALRGAIDAAAEVRFLGGGFFNAWIVHVLSVSAAASLCAHARFCSTH